MRKRTIFAGLLFAVIASLSATTARADEISEAFERGHDAYQLGRYELAIFEYRAALHMYGPHAARAHFNIGVCKHKLRRPQEAVTEYQAAVRLLDGKYPPASYALGIALQEIGRNREAVEAFTQAVKASGGKHAESLLELGLNSQRRGDEQAAVDFYLRVIKLSKSRLISPICHNNLGVILVNRGNYDGAISEFETAIAKSKGRMNEARDNLARCRELIDRGSKSLIASLKTAVPQVLITPLGE